MTDLYELKEKLIDTVEGYSKKEVTANNLDVVDKLAHAVKNICKIIDDSEYSSAMDRDYSRDSMSYARGRGRNATRDAMGRYSSHGDMISSLRDLMQEAPDDKTRMEFDHFIRKLETIR